MLSAQQSIQEGISAETTNRIDHSIFMFAVLLGSGAIVLLKSGIVYIPHVDKLGILLPVAVMGVYACVVTLVPRIRLRLDQAGDNLYYLGFTYTLCSLAITLYRFHTTEATADYIVSNFGIALATTIVGVVFRVWLHQMRDDPLELEREARSELTEAVGRLRTEIDQTVREFNHFNRTLQQSAQEAIEAQGNVALETLDKSTKQYSEVAVRAVGYLENCFTDFNKQATELNTNTGQIATALLALSKRIDDIEAPRDLLSEKLAPIFPRIAEAADALRALSKRIDDIEAPRDLLSEKLAPIFQRIAEAADQTAGRVSSERQRNQNLAKLTTRLEALTGSIEGVFNRVAEKEERVTTAIQHAVAVAGQTAELTGQIRVWTERFTEIETKQAEIATALAHASEAARHRDTALDESLHKAFADAMSVIGEYETRFRTMLQKQAELFESELQRADSAFTGLSRTLSEGASLLANELGRRN
jgi:chromosome segregation ATPase